MKIHLIIILSMIFLISCSGKSPNGPDPGPVGTEDEAYYSILVWALENDTDSSSYSYVFLSINSSDPTADQLLMFENCTRVIKAVSDSYIQGNRYFDCATDTQGIRVDMLDFVWLDADSVQLTIVFMDYAGELWGHELIFDWNGAEWKFRYKGPTFIT